MVNCGANLNLSLRLEELNQKSIKKYFLLLDSHRPIHHTNLIPKKNIWIVDDGTIDKANCPDENQLKLLDEVIDCDKSEAEEDEVINLSDDELEQKMKKYESNTKGETLFEDKNKTKEITVSHLDDSEKPFPCNSTVYPANTKKEDGID